MVIALPPSIEPLMSRSTPTYPGVATVPLETLKVAAAWGLIKTFMTETAVLALVLTPVPAVVGNLKSAPPPVLVTVPAVRK